MKISAGDNFRNANGKDYYIVLALSGLVSTLLLAYDPIRKEYVVATVYAAQSNTNEWATGRYFAPENRADAYRNFAEQVAARIESFITFADLEGVPALTAK